MTNTSAEQMFEAAIEAPLPFLMLIAVLLYGCVAVLTYVVVGRMLR